ncbi:MAG: hypothetical protein QOD07_1569 [Frankiaceae bacterium]|nr:hypothetical protein [Frankiaceae bacterium]
MSDFAPAKIAEVLARHQVACVYIGGFAAYLYGSSLLTTDVDIVPATTKDNYARLSAALKELNARVRAEGVEPLPFSHDADSLAAAGVWNLTTDYGDLDVTAEPSGTQGYPDLHRASMRADLSGISIELASLADIIRSKEAAGRDKDRRALPVLRELLARQLRERRDR